MILLKNENSFLPLDPFKINKIAIVGKHADIKFGRKKLGGGSSAVYPHYEITIREGLNKKCNELGIELVLEPSSADVVVICIGLEHSHDFKGGDHEGSDRLRYGLGYTQNKLIKSTIKQNPNAIVVAVNGQPFDVEPFIDKIPALLEAWYGGMEIGVAVSNILFGDVNPSGKLPVTWPKRLKDIPTAWGVITSLLHLISGPEEVVYDEDVFVGYRYYEDRGIKPRFPFGFGLSYTSFEYENLKLVKKELKKGEKLKVSCKVKNAGDTAGAEIIQLYISDSDSSISRPLKELKGFEKVYLEPGKSKIVEFSIDSSDLAFFNVEKNEWVAEKGEFKILIGSSSENIRLEDKFQYLGE
jgi:beta-glucosidase